MNNFIFNKRIGLILYARMSSKRFPGKVLKKVYDNKNILQIIVDNLKKIKAQNNLIVATSNLNSDKKIIEFCKKNKIRYFLGDHRNVFLRTKMCIKKNDLKYFVRICGDRPFFDVFLMKRMIKLMITDKYDIVTNVNPRTYPKGLTCEVAKSKIFEQVNAKKLSKEDKEHIFHYFYKSKKYNIYNFKSNLKKKFLNENFCIDNKNDIIKIKKILTLIKKKKKKINAKNLEKLLKF
jgi:spore coat polysaccharide biosynthesis protein SpsF (cytidylyltransferase family)|tara:strand:- start:1514 stop:2218 length:705 start_codon:yes stop_codon:yes gene_type:complete